MLATIRIRVPEGKFCHDEDYKCRMLKYVQNHKAFVCRAHHAIGFLKGGKQPKKCEDCLRSIMT